MMTDKLDWTQPLALRRDPFTRFDGPFTAPDNDGISRAVVNGSCYAWRANGKCLGSCYELDLIPLQTAPAKWLRCLADVRHGSPYAIRGFGDFGADRNGVHLIERAAYDELAEALRDIAQNGGDFSDKATAIASAILAKHEAKL